MKLDVFQGNTKSGFVEVKVVVADKPENISEHCIYQTVVARLSHERQGTLSTLTKSEVRGGGKSHGVRRVLDVPVLVLSVHRCGEVVV